MFQGLASHFGKDIHFRGAYASKYDLVCAVTEHDAVKLYLLYLIQCLDGTDDSNPVLAEQCEETLQFRMQEHRKLIDVNKIFDTVIS